MTEIHTYSLATHVIIELNEQMYIIPTMASYWVRTSPLTRRANGDFYMM